MEKPGTGGGGGDFSGCVLDWDQPDHVPVIVWASQAGITLRQGKEKGRLLMPGRILGPTNSNDEEWAPLSLQYCPFIRDDQGQNLANRRTLFPVLGTGGICFDRVV